MASTEEVKQSKKNDTKNGGVAPDTGSSEGDGWVDIQTDQPMYKADSCKATPLVGYLLYCRHMPEGDNGPWDAYVVKLTRPCLAVDGFDQESPPKTYPAGSEVLITATTKLRDVVEGRNFIRPSAILEVKITPTEKVKIGKGHTMWRYNVQANEKTVKARPAIYSLGAPAAMKALPASSVAEEEIPF